MRALLNYRKGFLFTVCITSATLAMAQLHFTPVWTGNGVDHMNFYVVKASIEGSNMQAGDEVAVFDGVHCVGAAVLSEEIIEGTNFLSFVASKNDATPPGINGYTVGNAVVIKLWDASAQLEIADVEVTYLSGSPVYAIGGTASFRVEGTPTVPEPPLADAGEDITVNEGEPVQLNGSASTDPGGAGLTYAWSSPPGISLDDSTLMQPGFTAPEVDASTPLEFILIVNNGEMDSEPDTVIVTVGHINQPPVFTRFPSDTTINRNAATVFEIGATDPDPYDTLLFTVAFDPGISDYAIEATGNGTIELSLTPGNSDTGPITVSVSLTDQVISEPIVQSFTLSLHSTGVDDCPDNRAISITPGVEPGCVRVKNTLPEDLHIDIIHLKGYVMYSRLLRPGQEFRYDHGSDGSGIYVIRYRGASVSGTRGYGIK